MYPLHRFSSLGPTGSAIFVVQAFVMRGGPLPLLGRGGGGNEGIGTVIFGLVILIGLFRATVAIYKLVERLTRKVLEKADDLVLEVN